MLKKFLTKVFAFIIVKRIEKTYKDYSQIQEKILNSLLKKAANTQFGQQHKFSQINNY